MNAFVRTVGWLCAIGALIGVIGGLVTGFVEPAVSTDRWSYPYTSGGFVVAQASFLLNHLLLLAGLLGLARSGATGSGRLGRFGLWTAITGMVGLSACEVAAAALADSAYPSPETNVTEALFGVTTILIGVGLVAAGVAVVRARRWTGWRRYITLVLGVAVFVMVIPGVFGPFLAGRLVLTAWMIMWAALGVALVQAEQRWSQPRGVGVDAASGSSVSP